MHGVVMMAKKQGRPKTGAPPTESGTRVARDLMEMARRLAAHRGLKVTEYLDAILREPIKAEWARMIRETDPARKKGGE